MRELVQIDSVTEHACGQVSNVRWHVLEPVSGHWSWIRVFDCCNQVVIEAADEESSSEGSRAIRRAA